MSSQLCSQMSRVCYESFLSCSLLVSFFRFWTMSDFPQMPVPGRLMELRCWPCSFPPSSASSGASEMAAGTKVPHHPPGRRVASLPTLHGFSWLLIWPFLVTWIWTMLRNWLGAAHALHLGKSLLLAFLVNTAPGAFLGEDDSPRIVLIMTLWPPPTWAIPV